MEVRAGPNDFPDRRGPSRRWVIFGYVVWASFSLLFLVCTGGLVAELVRGGAAASDSPLKLGALAAAGVVAFVFCLARLRGFHRTVTRQPCTPPAP